MSHSLLPKSGVLWNNSRTAGGRRHTLKTVATKYYTHFVTHQPQSRSPSSSSCGGSEWSGVVELRQPLSNARANRELRALLAQSFDLDSDDIRILHWARLH
jgi:uncharacterized protein YggU (UPF0235/DUF167 family)